MEEISNDNFETTIGPSVKVEGDLVTADNIKIDGIVSGKVRTDSNLAIGPAASIEASVQAASATVSGKIQGDVKATEFLHLTESAKIFGNIEARALQIDRGAFFSGNCKMPSPDEMEEGDAMASAEAEEPIEEPED